MKRSKGVALILIFVIVFALIVALADTYLINTIFPDNSVEAHTQYAFYFDDNEMIYYIQNVDGKNKVVKTDDIGNIIVHETIPMLENADEYVIQNIFVSKEKNIYIQGFHVEPVYRIADRAICIVLDKDGKNAQTLIDKSVQFGAIQSSRRGGMFASPSEDEGYVLIGLMDKGIIEVYQHDKYNKTEIELISNYSIKENVNAFYVNAQRRVLAVTEDGLLLISSKRNSFMEELNIGQKINTFRMYGASDQSDDGFYYVDGINRNVVRVNLDLNSSSVICSGQTNITDDFSFKDFDFVAVSPTGEIVGAKIKDDIITVYTGSESRMSEGNTIRLKQFKMDNFFVICIILGGILLSLLIWDIYVNFMKSKLSLMLKRGLVIGVILLIMVYVLLNVIIAPQIRSSIREKNQNQVLTAAKVLAQSVSTIDEESYAKIFSKNEYLLKINNKKVIPLHASLIDTADGNKIIASMISSANGYYFKDIEYAVDVDEGIDKAKKTGEYVCEIKEPFGINIYSFAQVDMNKMIVTNMSAEASENSIDDFIKDISTFVILSCSALFVILMLVEVFSLRNIAKLRKGVDAVSAGNYDVAIGVSSGDELENLSQAFTAMAKYIKENTQKQNAVNNAYHRFVPQKLFNLLGQDSILDIGKSSYVQKDMKVMKLSFSFLQSDIYADTQKLFNNINEVMEHFSPIVTEIGGTVYNFQADGFVAVFANSQQVLQAAVRIRENTFVLNNKRQKDNTGEVDVRLFVTSGSVMLGVVGDDTRMAVTAVSEVIERANRLGAIQKSSGVSILCTDDVVRNETKYRLRYIGRYQDKEDILSLYDVYEGDEYNLIKAKDMYLKHFNLAVSKYYEKDFEGAKQIFLQIVKASFDDGVSRNYLYLTEIQNSEDTDVLTYKTM